MTDYVDLREDVIARFGVASQAHAAVEYTRLIDLIAHGYANSDDLRSQVDKQLEIVDLLIEGSISARDVEYVTYDPISGQLRFVQTPQVDPPFHAISSPLHLTLQTLETLPSGSHFLYVLSTENSLMIEPTPLTPSDLFFPGADSARNRVRHPQLLGVDTPVLGAGEICVFHSAGTAYAALINNRSGHFRPPPLSLERVRQAVCRQLSLSASAVVEVRVGAYGRQ